MSHKENQIPFLYRRVLLEENQCMEILNEFWKNKHYHRRFESYFKVATQISCKFSEKNSRILLSKSVNYIWDALEVAIQDYVKLYPHASELNLDWGVYNSFNLQFYNPNEGFKKWHAENLPFLERFLVWTIYLSNTPDGGTEFLHQNHIEECEMGKVVICPADWQFTHRGQISTSRCKFIATGWYNYNQEG